jgi:hypothetical protein
VVAPRWGVRVAALRHLAAPRSPVGSPASRTRRIPNRGLLAPPRLLLEAVVVVAVVVPLVARPVAR